MPPLPFVALLVARSMAPPFQGSELGRCSWKDKGWTSSHMPWSGQPPEHKQTKFLLYRSCRTRRRPTVRHWDDRGEDFNAPLPQCGWTVLAETSADTCTCTCTCICACTCTSTCARMWTRTCSCFFELSLFFCRWGPLVFACVLSCSFPILSFYLSFYSQTVDETAVIHVSTFAKTAVTSALDWINPRSTVCRFICSHKT